MVCAEIVPGASSGTSRKGMGSQPRLRNSTAPMRASVVCSAALGWGEEVSWLRRVSGQVLSERMVAVKKSESKALNTAGASRLLT